MPGGDNKKKDTGRERVSEAEVVAAFRRCKTLTTVRLAAELNCSYQAAFNWCHSLCAAGVLETRGRSPALGHPRIYALTAARREPTARAGDTVVTPSNRKALVLEVEKGRAELQYHADGRGLEGASSVSLPVGLLRVCQEGRAEPEPVRFGGRKAA